MTKPEYEKYEQAVADFIKFNDVKPRCFGPYYNEAGDMADPFFSHRPCHCCISPLGGNRECYTFVKNDGEQFQADICTDCIYYLTYGRLDDATMMKLENL